MDKPQEYVLKDPERFTAEIVEVDGIVRKHPGSTNPAYMVAHKGDWLISPIGRNSRVVVTNEAFKRSFKKDPKRKDND